MVPFVCSEALPSSMIMLILLKRYQSGRTLSWVATRQWAEDKPSEISLQSESKSNADDCCNTRSAAREFCTLASNVLATQ